jgi:hypothetical protein
LVLVSTCKQLQENQAVAWILKTKENNPLGYFAKGGGESRKPTKN